MLLRFFFFYFSILFYSFCPLLPYFVCNRLFLRICGIQSKLLAMLVEQLDYFMLVLMQMMLIWVRILFWWGINLITLIFYNFRGRIIFQDLFWANAIHDSRRESSCLGKQRWSWRSTWRSSSPRTNFSKIWLNTHFGVFGLVCSFASGEIRVFFFLGTRYWRIDYYPLCVLCSQRWTLVWIGWKKEIPNQSRTMHSRVFAWGYFNFSRYHA